MLEELVQQLLVALVMVVVAAAGVFLRQLSVVVIAYLKQKMGVQNYETAQKVANTVVRALAQSPVYEQLGGPEKKELAMSWIQEQLGKMGVQMSHDEIDGMIEEAVQVMKSQLFPMPESPYPVVIPQGDDLPVGV